MATSTAKIAIGVGCGILLAVGALMATCAGCVAIGAKGVVDAEKAKKEALAQVEFEDVEGNKEHGYIKIAGKVRNKGTAPVSFVKVGVDLLDANGKVLDTDWTYAVSGEALEPGAAKSFDMLVPIDTRMEEFRYYVATD